MDEIVSDICRFGLATAGEFEVEDLELETMISGLFDTEASETN